MAALGEILRRFRFHGVPGAPAAAGVPVDRVGELEAELAPVFSALEETQRRAAELTAAAERDASRLRAEALEESRRRMAAARADAAGARAEAATARLERAADERDRVLEAGRVEAERIARVAAERAPALVDGVVRRALAFAGPPERPARGDVTGVAPGEEPHR